MVGAMARCGKESEQVLLQTALTRTLSAHSEPGNYLD